MKIGFADSFWKSLKKIKRHRTWWYKTYDFFRRDLPYFIENVWFFRKELWNFRSWDYGYNLQMFRRSLEKTAHTIEIYGSEVDVSRMKKVDKIKRAIHLLNNIRSDSYIEMAEKELGEIVIRGWEFEDAPDAPGYKQLVQHETPEEIAHNKRVYNRAREIEEQEWKELWKIFEGQNHEEYSKLYDSQSEEDKHKKELWDEWFDGSGIKSWWD